MCAPAAVRHFADKLLGAFQVKRLSALECVGLRLFREISPDDGDVGSHRAALEVGLPSAGSLLISGLRGMRPQHYIQPDCVGAKFSGRESGFAAQTIQNNLLPWIEVG